MTVASSRLPAPFGRLIDRSRSVEFTFEGKSYRGHPGDTIASALAAAGQWTLSRSFKYHRPRGTLSMAGHDANSLVQLPHEPNVLADRHPISPGLVVMGQHYEGSLARDRLALLERFGRFMPVGFYYKTFFRPKAAWPLWERAIRRMAGLGKVDQRAHHGYYDKAYGFYDVAVIGGGPAGMAAAVEAAQAGAAVLLVEEAPMLGGSLGYARFDADGGKGEALRAELVAAVEAEPRIEVLTDAVCQGWYIDNWLPVTQGNRLYKMRAAAVVVATGSFEQPAVFRNNDLPGVMLGSAAQRLMRLYAVKPGRRAVVLAANGDGYGVALDLLAAGVEVAAVADLREAPASCARSAAVKDKGVRILAGHAVREAVPDRGRRLAAVQAAVVLGQGKCAEGGETLACDLLCMSVGYTPAAQLLHHASVPFSYDDSSAMFTPARLPPHLFVAGSVAATFDLDAVLADGRRAGWAAAADAGRKPAAEPPAPADRGAHGINHPWPIFPHAKGKDFVDVDEDLQVRDIVNACADGFDDIQTQKRYSTVGMGPSQGRLSAVPSILLNAQATNRPVAEVGFTTVRPPIGPEKFGHLAGRAFEPVRHSAMHWRHLDAGAQMMPAGLWLRPAYYGSEAERARVIEDEVRNVRENVGLVDVSTLGGLDLRGPDAAEFLNRMYTWAYLKQEIGRARYLLMTDRTGVVIDDGVACRFARDHYYVTATTSGVDRVYRDMLWYNAQWRLDVDVTNVTAAYCGVNIAGPTARRVLERVCPDIDLSAAAFPYMGVRAGTVAGIPARVLRVGFVGELGYEIHAAASQGEALWDALIDAGRPDGIRPFGIEAQRVLRLEKGHIIISQDTDGLTIPDEADMAWAVARKKPFFVGQKAIEIQTARPLTRKLVGFVLADDGGPAPEESHLVIRDGDIVGRVTSVAASPSLGRVIGLAYVAPDQAAPGERFAIRVAGGRMIEAVATALPFYDPDNKRQEL